ncbi:23S rRNA pseudouridine(2605) synthase RluB [Chitinilyticum piscinae]|uniref:Pseudouridine synthase n=1 Tax=Chitinilyticum piscinae TaxID=2866724 RepID=A0A8J7KDF0_9NEIS|nr:pseudouridine synthase [Chitinilyticum piscinae]MBE9608709.1 rRNA pseudouridine synthase [Chitinilyticum piscinae]
MKDQRARRPQPAIRERNAKQQQTAATAGRRTTRDDGWQPLGNKARAELAQSKTAAKPRPAAAGDKPAAGAAGAATNERGAGRSKAARGDVGRAKRMKQRKGSQKEVAIQKQLREKRLPTKHLGEERLQKALAFTGLGSRREMEEVIEGGRVSINGQIVGLGAKVKPGDDVRVDGKRVQLKWEDRLPRIVMYHKQEGELVSRDDPEGRVTVFDRLHKLGSSKWIAIGRLDFNTSGLLLFTTSGDLANRMMHPSFGVEREYAVRVLGKLEDAQMKALADGIELEDGLAHFDHIVERGGEGKNTWYHVILREGRNREVRRMFEHFELQVSRLMRVRFGMFALPGRLKRGQFYELNETEVLKALKWAGLGFNGTEKDY